MVMDNPEAPAPHRKSGVHWLDLMVSVCALLTSAVSIFMAYQNSNAMEDLVHANSWPFMQLSSGNSGDAGPDDHTLKFDVSNAGTGPARIYKFEFFVDNHPVSSANPLISIANACCETEYRAVIAGQAHPLDAIGTIQTSRVTTTMLAANQSQPVLGWARSSRNAELWDAMDRARQNGRIVMHACYCSVFDECWDARSGALPERRANMCEQPAPNTSVSN